LLKSDGWELREALYLNGFTPAYLKISLPEDKLVLAEALLCWLREEIPSWVGNGYREVLLTEEGKSWLKRIVRL